jgi:hypothetical protein
MKTRRSAISALVLAIQPDVLDSSREIGNVGIAEGIAAESSQ